jgi:hypothetical protein
MWEDPIVAEIHRTRERLAAECGSSVKAVFADLRKRQAALGERLVRKKRGPDSTDPIESGRHPSPPSLPHAEPAPAK